MRKQRQRKTQNIGHQLMFDVGLEPQLSVLESKLLVII